MLQPWIESFARYFPEGDILLLWYYFSGVGLGLVVLAVLSFFPGTSTGSSPDLEMKEEDEEGKPAWAGDQIPPEELEQVRKMFRLTPEQMKQVVETSRQQAAQQITSSSWTPHQKLNTVVYVIMLSVLVYVLNRDYGNLATIWFVQTFPKEAHTLGLIRHP